MKKAKIILSCVAILAVVAGALAFRASRLPANIYTLLDGNKVTSITIGNIVYTTTIPNCTLKTPLRVSTDVGTPVAVSSTTTNALSTTVFISAGHPNVTTTFAYCTAWVTATAVPDGD